MASMGALQRTMVCLVGFSCLCAWHLGSHTNMLGGRMLCAKLSCQYLGIFLWWRRTHEGGLPVLVKCRWFCEIPWVWAFWGVWKGNSHFQKGFYFFLEHIQNLDREKKKRNQRHEKQDMKTLNTSFCQNLEKETEDKIFISKIEGEVS